MRGLPLALLLSAVLWAVILVTLDAAIGWWLVETGRPEFAAAEPESAFRAPLRHNQ